MKKLIYPDICRVCGSFFNKPEKHKQFILSDITFEKAFNEFLCKKCIKKYKYITDPFCSKCGKPVAGVADNFFICGECIQGRSKINHIRSCFFFKDSIVDIVHMLKYNNCTFFAEKTAFFILKSYLDLYKEYRPDLVLPVPLHKAKLRKRGYNQTFLMSDRVFKLAKKESVEFPEVKREILIKRVNTKSQTGLGMKERKENLKKVFLVKDSSRINKKRILLIDDVITTGTTLEECAGTLIKAGAGEVDAITFARAL